MDDTPLQLALRELQSTFTSPRALSGLAAVTLVLGLSGPFNTYDQLGPAERLIYWLAIVVATYATGRVFISLIAGVVRRRIANRWARLVVEGVACSVPVTLVVLGINRIAFKDTPGIDALVLWFYCALIATAVMLVLSLIAAEPGAGSTAGSAGAAGGGPPAGPAILGRVPLPQRGRLLALSVEDHYVEVLTDRGRALVLIRLSDAIRETSGVAGVQIHRSHWVALDAVRQVTRSNGRVMVELSGGQKLPVSRGYLPAAREAGLLV